MDNEVVVDVRAMEPRERHPRIFKAWENLAVGDALKLVNDHDPKPLFYEFSAERAGEFEWTAVEKGPERWSVLIKRVAAATSHAPDAAAPRPSWAGDDGAEVVDVREDLRAGREPFQTIIRAAEKTAEGRVFVLRATFEPKPLYKLLGNKGFEAWPERLADEDWRVYFRRKPAGRGCGCGGHGHS
ncbi:MAG: DUF2249 domain-containing protein [Elusimicrobia bacterium]|nr:DUF2249 domain-containing protein [Elusimicrobiota bacterium]